MVLGSNNAGLKQRHNRSSSVPDMVSGETMDFEEMKIEPINMGPASMAGTGHYN